MARRAALIVLAVGLLSCGSSSSNDDWTCAWQCHTTGASGTATYPAGPTPIPQCTADHGADCNSFECNCNQS